ncbi:hypothetical protein HY251_20085 [bacterium]|nr:hypothetical protein [bacterium]
MEHATFAAAVLVLAFLFAKVEIHIEGKNGWAAELPTWRYQSRLTDLLYGGRPLTGYHLWLQLFVLAFAHLPVAFGTPWSLRVEARVLSFVILFWIVEDFLWFVLNPHYGLSKFRRDSVWWHRRAWLLFAPREYFVMAPLAVLLYFFGTNHL